jgi:predicted kinase
LFVECRASLAEVERRLRERAQHGDSASDATVDIARQQEGDFPPFDDLPVSAHWVIDTERDLDEALAPVEDALAAVNH